MSDLINSANQVIDDAVKYFLERINSISENGPFRKARKEPATFSVFKPANDEFYEYAYFERTLEWFTRDLLINPIIHGLFKTHDVKSLWPEGKEYVRYSTEAIENIHPFEFIIITDGEKVGVRYTGLCAGEVGKLIKSYDINRIIQIKWSDDIAIREESEEHFEVVTPEMFFSRYLFAEEYPLFMQKVMSAIEAANAEIGFETIPRLSLRYLSNFKVAVSEELSALEYEKMRFQVLPNSKDKKGLGMKGFDEQDYKTLNSNFKKRGLYRALLGKESFAKCFITAEYQYQIFKQGHCFDYTSVVCGYLKAVEQLIYKFLKINLSYRCTDNLWILKNGRNMPSSKYIKGETVRPNPKTEKMQVVFDKDHEEYFNITLSPMIWFLHDNVNGWEISNDGRLTIHSFLMNFADECRNDHFHKDNIDEFNTVSRIRNNALLIMYSLLGGYKLTGDYQEDIETLGITDDSFDRMYKKIQNLPKGMSKFIIYFPDRQPIRAYRHFVQEPSVYDENGSVVLSQIKLVEVDIFAADEYDKAMEGVYSDREFTLSCENIPARVSYINGGNEEIFISW